MDVFGCVDGFTFVCRLNEAFVRSFVCSFLPICALTCRAFHLAAAGQGDAGAVRIRR